MENQMFAQSSTMGQTIAQEAISPSTDARVHKSICWLCGRRSESTICQRCSDWVRAEAIARKRREDKGQE